MSTGGATSAGQFVWQLERKFIWLIELDIIAVGVDNVVVVDATSAASVGGVDIKKREEHKDDDHGDRAQHQQQHHRPGIVGGTRVVEGRGLADRVRGLLLLLLVPLHQLLLVLGGGGGGLHHFVLLEHVRHRN